MFEVFKVNKSEGFAVTARPSFFKVFVAMLLTATDPTNPPLMMWAASGQARLVGRWLVVSDIGSRLAIVSGIEAASRFDTRTFPPPNPRIRLFRSLPLRPAPQSVIESACACGFGSLSTALQERIRLSPLHRVSACFAALTPDVCRF